KRGSDYGWPECYYDAIQGKLVLAPEYGGDGGKEVGRCATKTAPIAAFPAHWAPNAMALYDKQQFPAHYRHGVFIAFHGSWDRAPYPQAGYNVVFQALAGDHASGRCEIGTGMARREDLSECDARSDPARGRRFAAPPANRLHRHLPGPLSDSYLDEQYQRRPLRTSGAGAHVRRTTLRCCAGVRAPGHGGFGKAIHCCRGRLR